MPDATEPSIGTSSDDFALVSSDPASQSSHLRPETNQIVLEFNQDIDLSSVTLGTIELKRESVDGSSYSEDVPFSMLAVGNKLYINIVPED